MRSLAAGLAATLFDGGRVGARIEVQNAVEEQALVAYEASILTALEDVENALVSYAAGRERLESRRRAAESARNAAQLARTLYEAGSADFQKVLDTDRTRLSGRGRPRFGGGRPAGGGRQALQGARRRLARRRRNHGSTIMNQTKTPLPDFLQAGKPGRFSGKRRWIALAIGIVVVVGVVAHAARGGEQQGNYVTEEAATASWSSPFRPAAPCSRPARWMSAASFPERSKRYWSLTTIASPAAR